MSTVTELQPPVESPPWTPLSASPIAHVIVDAAGVVRGGNDAFGRMFERQVLPLGTPFIVVVPIVQSELFWRALGSCCESRMPTSFDFEVLSRSGSRRTLQAIAAPLDAAGGEVQALFAIVDVGERARAEIKARRAHEAELRMRAQMEMLSSAHVAIGEAAADPERGLGGVLDVIVEQARRIVDADFAAVGLGGEGGAAFERFVTSGLTNEIARQIGPDGRVTAADLERLGSALPRSYVAVPIRHGPKQLGTLCVAYKRARFFFDAMDERLVRMLAHRASTALEQVRAVESESRQRAWLQAVVDAMPEFVVVTDASGAMVANAKARSFSIAPPGEPPKFDSRSADGRKLDAPECPIGRAQQGEHIADLEVALHVDDRSVPMLVSAAPVIAPDGGRMGAVCLCYDVSSLRALERLREEWAAVVVHDLRQPLSVIRFADELLARTAAAEDAVALRSIERIRVSAMRMWTMIEELLDTSLIESKRMRVVKKPTCIETSAREVVEQMRSLLEGRDVVIDVPPGTDTVVPADEERILQVLGNLVSNACKYGARGRPVMVRFRRDDTRLRVAVENEGETIAPDDLDRVFTRFFRADNARAGSTRGLGLGLYIVRGLVHAHGGEVSASSEDGRTVFTIALPVD